MSKAKFTGPGELERTGYIPEGSADEREPGASQAEERGISDFSGFSIEDLKVFAGARCLDIFDDFAESEIGNQPASVREAWRVGRAISESGKRASC